MPNDDGGYGARVGPVWRAVLRDYRCGAGARARARLGFLTPPAERGRLIWIRAGESAADLRLGIELLGAVRDKRLDVRIVLTFEQDYPELFERHMQPFRKVGVGYGPCDRPRVVRRVLRRFQPHGIIQAGGTVPRNLARMNTAPLFAVNAAPPGEGIPAGSLVGSWPVDVAAVAAWPSAAAAQVLPPADPQARFVEAQADVVLRALVGGQVERLWWWHGTPAQWLEWRAAWKASAWGHSDILLVSLGSETGGRGAMPEGCDLAVSAWDRGALPPGTVLHLDDPRWFAAAASAAHAVHLAVPERAVLWQGLAGGAAVSLGVESAFELPCPVYSQPGAVLDAWRTLRDDVAARRRQGDAARRRFWEERRQVDANFDAVLRQVWDW